MSRFASVTLFASLIVSDSINQQLKGEELQLAYPFEHYVHTASLEIVIHFFFFFLFDLHMYTICKIMCSWEKILGITYLDIEY